MIYEESGLSLGWSRELYLENCDPLTLVSFLLITGSRSSQSELRYLVHINKLKGSTILRTGHVCRKLEIFLPDSLKDVRDWALCLKSNTKVLSLSPHTSTLSHFSCNMSIATVRQQMVELQYTERNCLRKALLNVFSSRNSFVIFHYSFSSFPSTHTLIEDRIITRLSIGNSDFSICHSIYQWLLFFPLTNTLQYLHWHIPKERQ